MKSFDLTIHSSGHDRAIILEVYPNRDELIKAVRESHKLEEMDMGDDWYNEAQATTTGQWLEDDDGKVIDIRVIVRLSEGLIKIGQVAHEATHAGVFIYQNDIQKTIPDMEREEKLCYLVGEISEKIAKKLLDNSIKIIL